MNVAIRVDASVSIGSGHVMRCLALADAINSDSNSIIFLCADLCGNLAHKIESRGYTVTLLPRDCRDVPADKSNEWLGVNWLDDLEQCQSVLSEYGKLDWLIVDHYAIDAKWEHGAASFTSQLMVIDDLANRTHNCELLLDQTLGRNKEDYQPWLDISNTKLLVGSQYSLLRPEFKLRRVEALKKRNSCIDVKHILLTMGGMDLDNVSAMVLDALDMIERKSFSVKVVLGSGAPHYSVLQKNLQKYHYPVELLSSVDDMASLMVDADLAIGAAGTTSWERCALGLPTILIQTADNQKKVVEGLAAANAVVAIGDSQSLQNEMILDALNDATESLQEISVAASKVCDGEGVQLVAQHILQRKDDDVELRTVTSSDIDLIFSWQTEPEARRYSRNSIAPSYDEHVTWVKQRLASDDPYMIVLYQGNPVGILRLDRLKAASHYEVSILISSSYSGRGVGFLALSKLRILYPNIIIVAVIHEDNVASQALFKKLGYVAEKGCLYSYPQ